MVDFCKVDTKENVADIGTKCLDSNTIKSHRDRIMTRIDADGTPQDFDKREDDTGSNPGHVKQQDLVREKTSNEVSTSDKIESDFGSRDEVIASLLNRDSNFGRNA